ncbi:MAG: phage portal protein [Clostridia bacterium]|nr:phage portal protein [Clostridia bacterium]MCI8980005.1 phage portal protein [Clostridia bacterium]MCI9086821.1 phage portal protein [Clostridia bacterium]
MIIDEELIAGGITPQLLAKLIEKHEVSNERYNKLYNYYIGRHGIMNRRKAAEGTANNKITANHAKYITDMSQSYLTGNPVTYSASEEYDIEPLKNAYLEQGISSLDSSLIKDMSIYGCAYELIYADGQSKPRSTKLSPQSAFVCYTQSVEEKPLFGIYYYKRYDLDGNCRGVECQVFDSNYIYLYRGNADSWLRMNLDSKQAHYFGAVPLIEYRNNEEKQGDFEQLIPLIDAYNLLQSDRVNDKEQFVDAFLFLRNCEIDSEEAQKLREERILMGYDNAAAEYLSKVLTESDIKVLRDDIKDDIHRFAMVPDLSDESFGNNLSGVAIKYKLLGFEQHIKNKERIFAKSLRKRFELYNTFLALKGSMQGVPTHRVDIVFTYNLPANELEVAQMISYLQGLASNETLLDQLSFVGDAKEEAELAKKEQSEKHRAQTQAVEDMAAGGGY